MCLYSSVQPTLWRGLRNALPPTCIMTSEHCCFLAKHCCRRAVIRRGTAVWSGVWDARAYHSCTLEGSVISATSAILHETCNYLCSHLWFRPQAMSRPWGLGLGSMVQGLSRSWALAGKLPHLCCQCLRVYTSLRKLSASHSFFSCKACGLCCSQVCG